MVPRLFGTSGIRRLAAELTDDFVRSLAFSLAAYADGSAVAVGRDSRPSSQHLSLVFSSALCEAGIDVFDLGLASTPTVAMASEEYKTGVVVTASHNPPEYNGFKFWSCGRAYSPAQEREIEKIFHARGFAASAASPGKITSLDYSQNHIDRILSAVGRVPRPVKVLLDCANGAGAAISPKLLSLMGCEVIAINTATEGRFAHGLEPTAENLRETCRLVVESGAEVGVVHDGDADRTAAIGRAGKLIDWDDLLSVLAYGKDRVVTTVDASMRVEDVCSEVVRTPIGDVAVADSVCSLKADFGGEPSGSFIFPEAHLFPDGPLAAAKIVKLVSEDRFYPILSELKKYPVERVKLFYRLGADRRALMEKIRSEVLEEFEGETEDVSEVDGVRLGFSDGWALVRPSGTEPCVRITSEAGSEERLSELVERCRKRIQPVLDVA